MNQFEDYFSDEKIIAYLCKLRVKIAKQRNKSHLLHLLTDHVDYNYHLPKNDITIHDQQFNEEFYPLFPPRKNWIKPGIKTRCIESKEKNVIKLSTTDKNYKSLIHTIIKYRKKNSNEPFVIKLNNFISDIQNSIKDPTYKLSTPEIYPQPKNRKNKYELKKDECVTCRPVSLFNLKDKIIISFTNKYLTRILDGYFETSSLAFRSTEKSVINHHSAIKLILKYKEAFKDVPLWVAECDMQKFFDTVDHKVIKGKFATLIENMSKDFNGLNFANCSRIFYDYLDCYCFNNNVLPKNSDEAHWVQYDIKNGQYGWVEDYIKEKKLYEDISKERIGIPQGGALSGLIANIVLDSADKQVKDIDEKLFYVRFCDDMVIMHPNEDLCRKGIDTYINTLEGCKLVPHYFVEKLKKTRTKRTDKLPRLSFKPFWEGKSKGPYKWDSVQRHGFPWIGFVGYEIHYTGSLRVRKSSLLKEINKQKKIVSQIKGAIKNQVRVSKGTITESAIKKLIGMAVGRIELWNYTEMKSEMCWKNGFQELNANKYSIKQIKRLDKNRSKLYYSLKKELEILLPSKNETIQNDDVTEKKNRQFISYDKPFSYYYHVIEKDF